MNFSKLAVKRPVTVAMITLMVILLGIISLTKLPIDMFPEIEIPVAIVITQYNGVGPQEIESLVTEPVESSLATVADIKSVRSSSMDGQSIVIAEFNYGTDMEFATLDMREKVDRIKGYLPDDATEPMVMKLDPNAMPIIDLSVAGDMDLGRLQQIVEDDIKPKLERVSGVASVDVAGGYEEEVEIVVNQERLAGYNLNIDQLSKILQAENLNLPAGVVNKGTQELSIRTVGKFKSVEEIKNLPLTLPTGGTVKLSDIANVERKNKDLDAIVKTDGVPSINISIQKQSGSNTVSVAQNIRKELGILENSLDKVDVTIVNDQSEFIKSSIATVVKNAVIGGILAILVLFTFLRNMRTTVIIGTAIPISIIATFTLVYFSGITLNMMTLGGLALGVGMLVDNAIVVLENIYRFRQDGYSKKDAAIEGTKEVATSVVASTLTTIAVFAPMVFVGGMTSALFKEFSMTVSMSLVASLVVSLTVIPMLSSKYLVLEDPNKPKKKIFFITRFFNLFDTFITKVENGYKRLLKFALHHKKTVILVSVGVFVASLLLVGVIGMEFFPSSDEGKFQVSIKLPEGSELEKTQDISNEVESYLTTRDDVETIFVKIGTGGSKISGGGSTNAGTIDVVLKDGAQPTEQVINEVISVVRDIPGAEIKVKESTQSASGGASAPISVSIKGDELDALDKISQDFVGIMKGVEGTRDVESSYGDGIPELQISVKRDIASQYGLNAAMIANAVKGTVDGTTATKYKIDGDEIDVIVKGESLFKQSISNLKQASIPTPAGIKVTLSQVADINLAEGPVSISRTDQIREVSVTSQLSGRDLGSVTRDIKEELKGYEMPEGYSFEFGGENKSMMDAFVDLGLALVLAVILVYMVIASQFESIVHPFTIMFSVPLAVSGGLIGLFVTARSLGVTAFIGVIMLAGIVVNNAIVLVEYINVRRRSGESIEEAILNAGPIRLRPILMTTLTTVLGLLPLALGIGDGAEMQAPMATVVIGGLMLSTLLTLVFIPVLYTIFDKYTKKDEEEKTSC